MAKKINKKKNIEEVDAKCDHLEEVIANRENLQIDISIVLDDFMFLLTKEELDELFSK